ncbi:MAG: hypothetical protein QMC81_08655 [Thermoanaerobacterales bacterium]|nr:hypothetical protein [Bacillota bacterium]MDI6907540.1 hypothetical protein [Thermoanaerobacterales bacterium]
MTIEGALKLEEAVTQEAKAPEPAGGKARGRVRRQDYLVIALGLVGLIVAKLAA